MLTNDPVAAVAIGAVAASVALSILCVGSLTFMSGVSAKAFDRVKDSELGSVKLVAEAAPDRHIYTYFLPASIVLRDTIERYARDVPFFYKGAVFLSLLPPLLFYLLSGFLKPDSALIVFLETGGRQADAQLIRVYLPYLIMVNSFFVLYVINAVSKVKLLQISMLRVIQ